MKNILMTMMVLNLVVAAFGLNPQQGTGGKYTATATPALVTFDQGGAQSVAIYNTGTNDVAVAINVAGITAFTNLTAAGTAIYIPAGVTYTFNVSQPRTIQNVAWIATTTNVLYLSAY